MLAEGFAWPPGIWRGKTPRLDGVMTQTVSGRPHCADTGWILGHVRYVVGKVALGQISLINPLTPNDPYRGSYRTANL